jgi:hypothetical protein
MSLINFNDKIPPHLVSIGSANSSVASNNCLFNICNSILYSNKITRVSNSRISFQESGVYEFIANITAFIDVPSSMTASFQTGINGVFTTRSFSSAGTGFNLNFGGPFKFCIEINNGDYFEMRALTSGAANQMVTTMSYTFINNTEQIPFTVKRLS